MVYHPINHNRHSIRLPGYDYALAGAYFVTLCTRNRQYLFSKNRHDAQNLNAAGKMLHDWYRRLEENFPHIRCDAFIAMPNHIHFILFILDGAPKTPLHIAIRWFKTMTTNKYIQGVKEQGWKPFAEKLWQRGYYERIIRGENELQRAQEYILANPANWHLDPYRDSL